MIQCGWKIAWEDKVEGPRDERGMERICWAGGGRGYGYTLLKVYPLPSPPHAPQKPFVTPQYSVMQVWL